MSVSRRRVREWNVLRRWRRVDVRVVGERVGRRERRVVGESRIRWVGFVGVRRGWRVFRRALGSGLVRVWWFGVGVGCAEGCAACCSCVGAAAASRVGIGPLDGNGPPLCVCAAELRIGNPRCGDAETGAADADTPSAFPPPNKPPSPSTNINFPCFIALARSTPALLLASAFQNSKS